MSTSPQLGATSTRIDLGREDALSNAETSPPNEFVAEPRPDEGRRRRIAERAYGRAERRGFAPGKELDDWLAAEAEEDQSGPEQASR